MKISRAGITALTLVFLFTITASAQRTTRQPAKRPAAPPAAAVNQAEIRDGSQKVSAQIVNVTRFLYTLGGIAIRIEDMDAAAKRGQAATSAVTANNENKAKIIQAIRNLRAGITQLEMDFRLKQSLRPFVSTMDGASQLVAESEQLAAAGRFTDAGRPLLTLVEKLSDTLATLP